MSKIFKDFLYSFKFGNMHLKQILYDSLFWLVMIIVMFGLKYMLSYGMNGIDASSLNSNLMQKSAEEIQDISGSVAKLGFFVVSAIVIMVVSAIGMLGFTRGIIYSIIMAKKFSSKIFWKFAGLYLIILLLSPIVLIFLSFATTFIKNINSVGMMYTMLGLLILITGLILYVLTIVSAYIAKTGELFNAIGKGLSTAFGKFNRLYIPLCFVLLIFVLSSFLFSLLQAAMRSWYMSTSSAVVSGISSFLPFVYVIVFAAWARTYVVKEAAKLMAK
jgi:hypothetical protein